ncbi:MAG: YceI family protein [Aureisphaera sp.]
MKTLLITILFLLNLSLVAQTITINEAEAQVTFVFLDEDVEGTMDDFNFTGQIDLGDLESSVISGSVATKSLDTNNWFRSRHLRSKKYFYANEHPSLSFTSTAITGTADSFQVEGTLTIKGISNTVTWQFTNIENELKGTTSINTQDFKVNIYEERERNAVDISINLPYDTQ